MTRHDGLPGGVRVHWQSESAAAAATRAYRDCYARAGTEPESGNDGPAPQAGTHKITGMEVSLVNKQNIWTADPT